MSSADPISDGQPVTISGVAAAGAGQAVTLLARTAGGAFVEAAKATTDGTGHYSFTQTPLQNTAYRVSSAATRSSVLFEGVAEALSLDPAPSAAIAGQQLTFSGTLTPADGGGTVELERQYPSGLAFHAVAAGTLDSTGAIFTITDAFSNVGSYVLRIKVPADAQHQASVSAPFTVHVSAAPTVALAPQAPVESPVAPA
jgi:hypothetical protein